MHSQLPLVMVFVVATSLCVRSIASGQSEPNLLSQEDLKNVIFVCLDGEGEGSIRFDEALPVSRLEGGWNRDSYDLPPYEPEKKGPYVRHYSIEFLGEVVEVP